MKKSESPVIGDKEEEWRR